MDMTGHDNYQQVRIAEDQVSGGARTRLRIFKMRLNGIEGKRVLDIGCNAGMLSIDAKQRGASYVLGIDRGAVINVAREQANLWGAAVDFRQLDMESAEFKKLAEDGGFDFVYFCAMFDHVRPENRTQYLQFLDHITNEVMLFETNFERNPEPYLELINKYMSFDGCIDCGCTGDRKESDYHMYRFERHRNEPYEVKDLPCVCLPINEVFAPHCYYQSADSEHTAKVAKLKENIARNGQVRPCLITRHDRTVAPCDWMIVEGVHRYIAMTELGVHTIKVKDITGMVFKSRTDV